MTRTAAPLTEAQKRHLIEGLDALLATNNPHGSRRSHEDFVAYELHQIAALRFLQQEVSFRIAPAVSVARSFGATWDVLADAYGATRSAVIQRFNKA